MNSLVEDFLQRTANKDIHHSHIDRHPDEALDIDAWGNEWEPGDDEDED